METTPQPQTYTIKEIKDILRIGQVTAYKLIHENPPFTVLKIGHNYRIPKESFLRWFSSRSATPANQFSTFHEPRRLTLRELRNGGN